MLTVLSLYRVKLGLGIFEDTDIMQKYLTSLCD